MPAGAGPSRDPRLSTDTRPGRGRGRGSHRQLRKLFDYIASEQSPRAFPGGYAISGLREGAGSVFDVLLEPVSSAPPALDLDPNSILERVVTRVAAAHGSRVPGIGAR